MQCIEIDSGSIFTVKRSVISRDKCHVKLGKALLNPTWEPSEKRFVLKNDAPPNSRPVYWNTAAGILIATPVQNAMIR